MKYNSEGYLLGGSAIGHNLLAYMYVLRGLSAKTLERLKEVFYKKLPNKNGYLIHYRIKFSFYLYL